MQADDLSLSASIHNVMKRKSELGCERHLEVSAMALQGIGMAPPDDHNRDATNLVAAHMTIVALSLLMTLEYMGFDSIAELAGAIDEIYDEPLVTPLDEYRGE